MHRRTSSCTSREPGSLQHPRLTKKRCYTHQEGCVCEGPQALHQKLLISTTPLFQTKLSIKMRNLCTYLSSDSWISGCFGYGCYRATLTEVATHCDDALLLNLCLRHLSQHLTISALSSATNFNAVQLLQALLCAPARFFSNRDLMRRCTLLVGCAHGDQWFAGRCCSAAAAHTTRHSLFGCLQLC